MAGNNPYLSVVATARNDNHGGNLLGRMQLFVSGLLEQCRRHDLPAELVLVEWNPPADRPRLAEALSWPAEGSPCAVRVIEVPAQVHNRYRHAEALPLYQMIAKNVGIRRARGEFVLATNIDILFGDELVKFLAERRLRPDALYRINRHDVPADVPGGASMEEQLDYCRGHVIRVNCRSRTYRPAGRLRLLGGALARPFRTVFEELVLAWTTATPAKRRKAVLFGPVLLPFYLGLVVCSQARNALTGPGYPRLHTNACGDFTLLARDLWFAVRGYAELDVFSMHLDSLVLHAAHHAGAREQVLADPMRIYHVEHGLGSGWSPEGQARLNERLAAAGIPQISFAQYQAWARQMQRERRPLMVNDASWGLASEDLPEAVLSTGRAEPSPV